MLAECSEVELERMLERSSIVAYEADEVIHHAEDPLEFYYILLTGRWRIVRGLQGGGQPLEVERDRPGTWFGGMEFLDALAPMRAVAVEQSVFLRVPRPAMLEFMQQGSPLTRHLVRGVQAAIGWLVQEVEKERS
jgi:CRP-like cAMP-binding protein